jgi:hypothetical protein
MLRFPATYGHNAFAFNGHLNADGSVKQDGSVLNTVLLDERRIDPNYRDLRDPLHLAQGGQLGRIHKGMTLITLRGRIQVPDLTQQRVLADRERAMKAAFDPYLCSRDSPTTQGAYAFDFTEDTADTATYATGLIPLRYYCRPTSQPRLDETLLDGASRPFSLALLAGDPRQYEQTEQTLVLTPGAPSGDVVNRGTTSAPIKLTIVMSGAGNAAFTITRSGIAFVLNLAGLVNGDTVVVVMETCGPYGTGKTVTLNGANAFARKTSGPTTWLDAAPGTTSFAITNTGGVTSCTVGWYSARA